MFDDLYDELEHGAEEMEDADLEDYHFEGADPFEDDDEDVFDFGDDLPGLRGPVGPTSRAGDLDGADSQPSSRASRRRRGSRGSGHGSSEKEKKWRSGHIPSPPTFSGDVETNPFCLRHYKRALQRWVTITRDFLPANEQALRALDALQGDAALELEEIDDSRYNHADGITTLLEDLAVSFGEKELFRKGGLIREFEGMVRVQGESVQAYVRRFRLMERKLQDARIPQYPSETRAVKLLDGLRLSETATAQLLLAAGNRYEFGALVDAIRVHYPAGLTLTGMTRHPAPLHTNSGRHRGRGGGHSHAGKGKGRSGGTLRWKTWRRRL